MRDFGKVKSSIWMSEKFTKLQADLDRLLYIYLLTNQHGNALGCYRIHIGYMIADLDKSEAEILEAMTRCQKSGLIEYDTVSKMVFIHDFLLHSPPSNQSHAKKIFSDTVSVTNEKFRFLLLRDISKACKGAKWQMTKEIKEELDTLSTRWGTPTPTETQTQTQTNASKEACPVPENRPKPSAKKMADLDIVFEAFWKAYPGQGKDGATGEAFKGKKARAKKYFETILKKEKDHEPLIRAIAAGLEQYAKFLDAHPDRPSQHASTWLNGKGWEDDYTFSEGKPRTRPGSNRGYDPDAALDAALRDETRKPRGNAADQRYTGDMLQQLL